MMRWRVASPLLIVVTPVRNRAVSLWYHFRSRGFGKGVVEGVGVFSFGDLDVEFAGDADQLAGSGVGDDCDGELWDAAIHGGAVLENEATGATVEGSGDFLHGDVAGGAFDFSAKGEHLAFGSGFEIAVNLLVDGHAADGGVFGPTIVLRRYFYVEGSGGSGHDFFLRLRLCREMECEDSRYAENGGAVLFFDDEAADHPG